MLVAPRIQFDFQKSAGQGFMVSAFQNEYVNLLTLTKEDVVAINRLRRRSRKKPLRHFYLHTDGLYIPFTFFHLVKIEQATGTATTWQTTLVK